MLPQVLFPPGLICDIVGSDRISIDTGIYSQAICSMPYEKAMADAWGDLKPAFGAVANNINLTVI